jgi:hypothetical protein
LVRCCLLCRRFNEFGDLEKTLKEIFKGKDIPTMPQKQSKAFVDHNSQAFLQDRSNKLAAFLQEILTDPVLSEFPLVADFIGFPHGQNVSQYRCSKHIKF